jgi:hypothetical protein
MLDRRGVRRLVVVATAFGLLLAACGGNDEGGGGAQGGGGGGGSSLDVTEQEFAIAIPSSADAGEVTFNVSNEGEETHEFVLVKTDLGMLDLPTADDGSVDEEGKGIEPIDEIEDIQAGTTQKLTADLDAGSYVVFCNIVEKEDGEVVSHYQNGMRAELTVE